MRTSDRACVLYAKVFALLKIAVGSFVRKGRLILIDPSGSRHEFGDGTGEPVTVRIKSHATALKIAVHPDRFLGEAYMDEEIAVESGDIFALLELAAKNSRIRWNGPEAYRLQSRLRRTIARLFRSNPIGRAQRNVAHHYDLSGKLYRLFLDRDLQYSCAYYTSSKATLEQAQLAKKRHLAAKLNIKPGMKVLDIGSGWGGLGLYLASFCGAQVVGVTLSKEQYRVSRERAAERGLSDQVDFRLLDYRLLDEKFDRIVSVGMFEHVGTKHYREFFNKIDDLLMEDGIACIHSIGRADGPGMTSSWINKYIFPGGYIPALSETLPAVEAAGLTVTDVEILRLHYAETLKEWRRRFAARRTDAKQLYDERFCKMWEFYLAASENMFRVGALNNFQLQLARRQEAVPLTRDYIGDGEKLLKTLDEDRPRLVV